jgi:porin
MATYRWIALSFFFTAAFAIPSFAQNEDAAVEDESVVVPQATEEKSEPWWRWSRMTGEWGGRRSRWEESGITFGGGLTYDQTHGAFGGVRRRWTSRGLLNLELTVDLKPLFGLEGGTFYTDYQAFIGRDASRDIGDIQAFSNIDANSRSQLAEFWYEQWLFHKALRFKVGRVDANSEFAFPENGADFINSSMGFSPTIFLLPTYPDVASGFNLFVYPTEQLSASFGVYDGALQRNVHTGVHGPHTLNLGDLFFIGEVDGRWTLAGGVLPGRLGLGGWGHTGRLEQFEGGAQGGTAGAYLVFDQMLWREHPQDEKDIQGIATFFQYGYADADVSEVGEHLGTGFTWTGLIPHRDEEVLGLGATWARLSDHVGFRRDFELALELFYKLRLTPWATIKPDLQYIINPSGGSVSDVLAATVRVELTF